MGEVEEAREVDCKEEKESGQPKIGERKKG